VSRRPGTSVIANPVLVGAVTILVVNVATVMAWFANQGLPFIPTREIRVELVNGANLLPGNEVREGGFRIGIVSDMQPRKLPGGKVGALVKLKIDDQHGKRMPVDTRIAIRPRSVLGLKYVEVQRGTSERMLGNGDTIPAKQTRFPVELDEFQNIFDEDTREGAKKSITGFGDALARRGPSLNRAIEELPRFMRHLEPVMRTLSEPDTRLDRFFGELGDFTRVTAPIADRYAHGFRTGADTFEAWSRSPSSLRATIEKSVPTMDEGIRSLRAQRPFLVALRDFSVATDEAARELPAALPGIIPALKAGTPVLRRTPEVNDALRDTLDAVGELVRDPATGQSLRALTDTVGILNPTLRFVGPYITVCNYFNYSWTHAAEHLSEPDLTGGAQRTLLNQAGQQIDGEGRRTGVSTLGAPAPANGGRSSSAQQHLHTNYYSAAVNHRGEADCESGQRGYLRRQNTYGPESAETVVDPHIPGDQGPTYTGLARVPEGQTFQRHPTLGPAFPKELDR
jgi:ABC-type transporter Mla subunit MlaD